MKLCIDGADHGGRAVKGVGLWPLASCDYRFESHRGHGCFSLVSFVCHQVQVSATGRSLVQRSPPTVVCLSVISKPQGCGHLGRNRLLSNGKMFLTKYILTLCYNFKQTVIKFNIDSLLKCRDVTK